jgi:hypothetical protein
MKNKVNLYKSLFNKSFFFDKISYNNVYQCPRITAVITKFFICSQFNIRKSAFTKVVLLFYLLIGQKPKFLVKNCNIRGIKKKKIFGLIITSQNYDFFLDFLVFRQLPLISFFQKFLLNEGFGFTFDIKQKIHDDDILFQVLKVADTLRYQVRLSTTSLCKSQLQTLLINFKIPCLT